MAIAKKPGVGAADPLLVAVADRIEELRAAGGMDPADLARAANVSLQYLWRLRKGRMNLSLRSISRFSLALGVPMAALLEGIEADPATLEKGHYERGSRED